jgi:hypothetical protein
MNIKVSIDFTPGSAKRLAYVCLTTVAVGVSAVAYAALPVRFQSQQKLTASDLNENFESLEVRLGALTDKLENLRMPVVTEWQTYVPRLTTSAGAAVGDQISTAFYRRVGDTLEVHLFTQFSGAPETGAPWWQWSIPDNLQIDFTKIGLAGQAIVGSGAAAQTAAKTVALQAYVRGPWSISASGAGSGSFYLNETVPVAFDSGGSVALEFRVPIVGWSATD